MNKDAIENCKDCIERDTCSIYKFIKQEKQAYFANVEKGDEVVCLLYGKGVVTGVDIDGGHVDGVCFHVRFDDKRCSIRYRKTGISTPLPVYSNQTLFYAGTTTTIIPAPEPERMYVPRIGDVIEWVNVLGDKCTGIIQDIKRDEHFYALLMQKKIPFAPVTADAILRGHTFSSTADITFIKHYNTMKEAINSKEFNLNF